MDAYLKSELNKHLNGVDPRLAPSMFEELDDNFSLSSLIFLKLRGSVRLVLRMVRTPEDTKKDWDNIFSFNFGK